MDWLTFPAPPIGPDGKALRRGDPARELTEGFFKLKKDVISVSRYASSLSIKINLQVLVMKYVKHA